MRKVIYFSFILLVFSFFSLPNSVYADDISDCGQVTTPGVHTLTNDISGDCLIIMTSSGVIIDGAGQYTITGNVYTDSDGDWDGFDFELRNVRVIGNVYSVGGFVQGDRASNGGDIVIATSTIIGNIDVPGGGGNQSYTGGIGGSVTVRFSTIQGNISAVGGTGGTGTDEVSGNTANSGNTASSPGEPGGNGENGAGGAGTGTDAGQGGVITLTNSYVTGTVSVQGGTGGAGGTNNNSGGNGGDGYSCSTGEGCTDMTVGGNGGNAGEGGGGGVGGNAGSLTIFNTYYSSLNTAGGDGGAGGASLGSPGSGGLGGCDLDLVNGCAADGSPGGIPSGPEGADGSSSSASIDNDAPIISSVASSTADTTATITWTTDILSNSAVNYGLTTSYTATTTGNASTTSHTVNLAGLSTGTTYHFRVRSVAISGSQTVSGDYTFTTTGAPADSTPPTITSVSSDKAAGSYKAGEVIDIDVTFSEAVTSTGNVTVTLETGTTDRTCTFSVSNSTTGTCNYTVQAGDTSADLTTNSISGTIADQSANSMVNFTPATNLAANEAIVIDTTAPTSFTTGSVITTGGTVTASKWNATNTGVDVTVPVANDSSLTGGTIQIRAEADGSFANLGSAYTILVGDLNTSKTISINAATLEALSGFSEGDNITFNAIITDLATNSTTGTISATSLDVDQTLPTISSVSSDKAAGTYGTGEVIDIDVTFSEAVTSTGNVTVTLETGTTDRTCTFTVSSATSGTCNYTVQAGDTSADLTTNSISGTITDAAGNAMSVFTPVTNLAANEALVIDTNVVDNDPPSLSSGAPSGTLSAGTTSTNLEVTTDESATCKYDTNSGVAYASMTGTFDTTGGTSHSESITGLSNGTSYNYYVRCEDGSSNENVSDYTISFSVASPSSGGGGGGSRIRPRPTNTNTNPVIDSYNQNFSIGSTGPAVVALQQTLITSGFLVVPPGVSLGYYGPLTADALRRAELAESGEASLTPTPNQNFQIGDTGNDVILLQQNLISRGLLVIPPGVSLGYYGPLTHNAYKQYLNGEVINLNPTPISNEIKKGSTGDLIIEIQNLLIGQRYLTMPPGISTGYFGELTEDAVRKFQLTNGISPVTGIVDEVTLKRLRGN